MITPKTRVSDALAERPSLREVLPALHPAFAKLNHPVLGKILPRLTTVADAARMTGVDLDTLVAIMNLPEGEPVPAAFADAGAGPARAMNPMPAWFDPSHAALLDVGPVIEAGENPLARILAALRGLPPGGQLTVSTSFEPVPLIGLLARQGWVSWTRWEDDVCLVTFTHRLDTEGATGSEEAFADAAAEREGDGWRIDVSRLPPPEPMRRVLAALDLGALPLRVIHAREPALLYPKLVERGLVWEVRPRVTAGGEDGVQHGVEIHVRRP